MTNITFKSILRGFRRDDGDRYAYWLNWEQILAKTTDAVRRGATEICMQVPEKYTAIIKEVLNFR